MIRTTAIMAAMLVSAGCTVDTAPVGLMLGRGDAVSPVFTEYSSSLRCLGGLIDQTAWQAVSVIVRDIDDTTVPVLNEERRLSMGGAFVLHTAISRLESTKVLSVVDDKGATGRRLTLSGAWTQDDLFAERAGVGMRARLGQYEFGLGGRKAYDFIAGDFLSSVNGRVLLSTAIGVALSRNGEEALLVIDDGRNAAQIGLDRRMVQGAQMAQRRILEAAVLVHLAHHFRIDYRGCLAADAAGPVAFTEALNRFEGFSGDHRTRAVQLELQRLGFLAATPTGRWDSASRAALTAFQVARRLPPSGRPSGVLYALLATSRRP